MLHCVPIFHIDAYIYLYFNRMTQSLIKTKEKKTEIKTNAMK